MSRRTLAKVAAWSALVLLAACGPAAETVRPEPPLRNVLLVTIDTLRADYVHAYGFQQETTPQIDALAARGVLFENAVAASSVTAPSHATIMTSRYPREHSIGVVNGGSRLEGGETLAERFGDAGYDTAAFVGNIVLRPLIGLDRGFALYDAELPSREPNRPRYFERNAEATSLAAIDWLRRPRDDTPFFLWVHYQDPHGPYTPPSPYLDAFREVAGVRAGPLEPLDRHSGVGGIPYYQKLDGVDRAAEYARRYAAEIAYADHWIGRLLEAAEEAGAGRGTVVLLTADHGESLGEDGFYFQHGHATTPELARSPFVLAAPGVRPARRREAVHHVDVMPTLLELAGLPVPAEASGLSLAPFLASGEPIPERVLFCDIGRETAAYSGDSYLRIRGSPELWGDWAAGRSKATGEPPETLLVLDAYRREATGEWTEVDPEARLVDAAKVYLKKWTPVAPLGKPTEEEEERLRALGYLAPEPEDEPHGGERTLEELAP